MTLAKSQAVTPVTSPYLPVSSPALIGNEAKYVAQCVGKGWISSAGSFVEEFEAAFASHIGVKFAVSTSSGTTAVHLALRSLGVQPGDEVIVPTLTFVASVNPILECGAVPVLVDSDPLTGTCDVADVAASISSRTVGIVPVHLYGHPAEMNLLRDLAGKHGLWLLEDAAEAIGSKVRGKRCGSFGDAAVFSFYGNKTLTTGEGGMLVTDDEELSSRARILRGQGQDPQRRYWFIERGYNYRMTNVAAAIGVGQVEKAEWHIKRRRETAMRYNEAFASDERISAPPEADWATNGYWLYAPLLSSDGPYSRDEVMELLAEQGIETRAFFTPMHQLPIFEGLSRGRSFPVADQMADCGINLPSGALLAEGDLERVSTSLKSIVRA